MSVSNVNPQAAGAQLAGRPVAVKTPNTSSQQTSANERAQEVSPAQQQKAAFNAAILEATATSLSVKDQPLSLVLRSAIEKINELLTPEFGTNAIESAVDSGLDVSPEATADRIVSLATGFFQAFSEQHPGEENDERLNNFLDVIGSGIEQGFAEAREILDGLQVLEGDIATNIDRTYELVQEGLSAFRETQSANDQE